MPEISRTIGLVAAILCMIVLPAAAVEVQLDGRTVDLPVCGGALGLACGPDQWCDYPDEHACGAEDTFGTCRLRPRICGMIYQPVCGCDGRTYGNGCEARGAGTDAAYTGACRPAE
ncbi:MAG TPA: hypothetical protein VK862_13590 [Afifellaceae bacterium]|nr:hypothetical protein [Afifellaceae bacterium]